MRWILILPILLLPVNAQNLEAQEGVMDLPDKAVVNQFGENQLLEFRPNPDGSPRDYTVYGLTRRAATPGEELRPLNEDTPVATASQLVRLRTDLADTATIEYRQVQVAYLRVRFTVSVQDGELTRTQVTDCGNASICQRTTTIARVRPGINLGLGWGLAWVATFGLIGIFAWPNATAEIVHDEVVPLNAASITFTVGGGGGCLAFSGAHDQITVNPSQLQPGRLYEVAAGLRCGGLFQGNVGYVGQQSHHLVGFRVFIDGQLVPDPFAGRGSGYSFAIGSTTNPTGPLYWNVPDSGYTRRVGLIDRGVYPTRTVPVQPSVPLVYSYNAMYRETRGPVEEGEDYYQGFRPRHSLDHPVLGQVLIGEYAPTLGNPLYIRLYRVLDGPSTNPAGLIWASVQPNEMSLSVNGLTWNTEPTTAPDGTTVTRQVPVYSLGSGSTYDLPDLRLQTLGDCGTEWEDGATYYRCNVSGDSYRVGPF